MFKKLSFQSAGKLFPYLIFGIVLGLFVNIMFFKIEYEQITENIKSTDEIATELQWTYIETVLREDYSAAGMQAKNVANRIDRDLRATDADIEGLKSHLETPSDKLRETAYADIFRRDIKGSYMYGLKNDNNDAFVATRKGIVMDLSLNCAPDMIPRTWEAEFPMHYNRELAYDAVTLLNSKSDKIIFWEFLPPSDPDNHYKMTDVSMEELKKLFVMEGIEGLKNIEFLAPAYITEDGDIFGVDDIGAKGQRVQNHKIIVVQGFNLYEQIHARHSADFALFQQDQEMIRNNLRHTLLTRTFSVVGSSLVILLIVFMMMSFNNRIFHDGFCPMVKDGSCKTPCEDDVAMEDTEHK